MLRQVTRKLKFDALLEQGHTNVWYYENIDVGRRGAATNAQRADMGSIIFSFLWNKLNRNND